MLAVGDEMEGMIMTAQDLEKLLAEVTPDWRPGGRFKAVISDGITGWDDPETVAGYRGHLVCESVNHPAIMELICMAPALARKVIAAEKLVEAAKVAIDVMEFVDGENDCRRGVSALEEALAAWEDCQ